MPGAATLASETASTGFGGRRIHALVALGGMAALSWEVVWQLEASLALGVSALGTALTLAATMGGMAAGSLAAGFLLRTRRPEEPLRTYGLLELAIGLSGLLLLPGFALLEFLDAWLYGLSPTLAPIFHWVAIVLLLAPPTCAMGATIPVFQLLARRHATSVSALYGWNTAGAATGVLAITFGLLPALGVRSTCGVVAAVNFAIFAVTLAARPRAEQPSGVSSGQPGDGPTGWIGPRLAQVVVLGTGFATFGLELAWFRALRSAFWSTSATFAILLAAVLIPLAVGARAVPWIRRRGISPAALLACAGAAILLTTPLIERMDLVVAGLTVLPTPGAYLGSGAYELSIASWFLISLFAVGPALVCLATALPWCLEEHPMPDASGRLYALNTLGAVLGSLSGAWLLLPNLGFAASAWLLGLLVFALAAAIAGWRGRLLAATAAAASLAVAVAQSSSPGRHRLYGKPGFDGGRVLALDEGPDFTTSVIEERGRLRYLLIDGFVATAENPRFGQYMYWMGSLPVLLHPEPGRGLVICFGTGRTANAVRGEGIARLDVVDVSPAVFAMAPFFSGNQGVLQDPRVQSITMDGRAWLRRSRQRYDVITLEPMPPNFSGVNALYSREFYEIAASRLEPGGVLAQWLPFHLVSPYHAASIAATLHAVFPDSLLWIDPQSRTGILLGRRGGGAASLGTNWPGLSRRTGERPLSDENIERGVFLRGEALQRYVDRGTVITDDNQLLAFSSMRPGTMGRRRAWVSAANFRLLEQVGGPVPVLDARQFRPEPGWRKLRARDRR